jgi:hypothetical protein
MHAYSSTPFHASISYDQRLEKFCVISEVVFVVLLIAPVIARSRLMRWLHCNIYHLEEVGWLQVLCSYGKSRSTWTSVQYVRFTFLSLHRWKIDFLLFQAREQPQAKREKESDDVYIMMSIIRNFTDHIFYSLHCCMQIVFFIFWLPLNQRPWWYRVTSHN